MFNPLNLFRKKSQSVVGIDVGSSAIKVVQLSRKGGKAVLETYGELALGPYGDVEIGQATNLSPEKLSAALKDVMKEAKITTVDSGMSIPYGASLIITIEMPAVPEKQLEAMIPIEARKYIPVSLTEVMLDWWVIPKQKSAFQFGDNEDRPGVGEKVDVLLVAIHKDTLGRFQTVVNESALRTSFFEIEIFSAVRSVLEQDADTHMIIDIGAASTKVYVVERGVVRGSHVINRGSQDVTAALARGLSIPVHTAEIYKRTFSQIPTVQQKDALESMTLGMDYVFSEANRIVLNYQKRYNKAISRVTIVGGGSRMENIIKIAEAHLQTKVVLGDPFSKTESPAFLEKILKTTGPEFAVAVGIALRKLQEIA
jgi:type IV pilus assembly protein PilM